MAQSTVDLRTALPFPATHRLTTSEPISDQASSPIRKTARHRYGTVGRARDLQPPHVDTIAETLSTPPAAAPSEVQVQWGYAI
ncbi:hypothetical protein NLJ89_g11713 [Agrocybe chaxingu]|uniref:Uncharacterized protein n=1 Tax=Agrocybe chaxingu TaxID=84603 RepID=A0A9W8JPH1_9AGAR|nr:hypothetical protein NLJ89_g11713 [Agrocybe chaxingu]